MLFIVVDSYVILYDGENCVNAFTFLLFKIDVFCLVVFLFFVVSFVLVVQWREFLQPRLVHANTHASHVPFYQPTSFSPTHTDTETPLLRVHAKKYIHKHISFSRPSIPFSTIMLFTLFRIHQSLFLCKHLPLFPNSQSNTSFTLVSNSITRT